MVYIVFCHHDRSSLELQVRLGLDFFSPFLCIFCISVIMRKRINRLFFLMHLVLGACTVAFLLFLCDQGERPDKWRLTEFSMFKGGSTWRPPPLPQLKTTLKAPVIEDSKSAVVVVVEKKGQLPEKSVLWPCVFCN